MSEPFLGEIIIFGGNFAPNGWAMCQGQLLSISQNTALFSILGTTYGGNGVQTFGLPDLRGRVPVGMGQGPGLSSYTQGEQGGVENVTLLVTQIPAHTHIITATGAAATVAASPNPGNSSTPAGNYIADGFDPSTTLPGPTQNYVTPAQAGTTGNIAGVTLNMSGVTASQTGGSLPHTNIQPFLGVNYIIALQGIFPSRG